jgi:hypothetical protein
MKQKDYRNRKIVGVAIKAEDGTVYSLPKPNRHHNVIELMSNLGIPWPVTKNTIQGFILDDGDFVDRRIGLCVAGRAMQFLPGKGHLKGIRELFSEDVW